MVKVTSIEYIDIEGEGVDVYDVEVPIDESFISNGVVLHNSPICKSLDHRVLPLSDPRRPPFHVNCRSTFIFVLKEQYRGKDIKGKRASKDGYVDNDSYYEWLKSQPESFQDSVLGKARAKLFRDGGLSATEFAELNINKNFEPLTLEEMRALKPLAFERAGL